MTPDLDLIPLTSGRPHRLVKESRTQRDGRFPHLPHDKIAVIDRHEVPLMKPLVIFPYGFVCAALKKDSAIRFAGSHHLTDSHQGIVSVIESVAGKHNVEDAKAEF